MRTLRAWVLVLLAVVLPIRGVLAAATLCPGAVGPGHAAALVGESRPMPGGHERHHAATGSNRSSPPLDEAGEMGHAQAAGQHRAAPEASHAAEGHGPAGHDHGKAADPGCLVCAAFCSAAALISAVAGVAEPRERVATRLHEASEPVPSFIGDGRKRPPRTT